MNAQRPNHSDRDIIIDLYGPEDGGWYTTRVFDWIPLNADLRDCDVRGYIILRSLVIEKYKKPIRVLTLAILCELIPGPNGKPSSQTRVRGILDALSKAKLICTPEGDPVKTSSRASAAHKKLRIRINDRPAEGYTGWRNTEAKLAFLTRSEQPQTPDQEAGRNSDPGNAAGQQGGDGEGGAGRNSDPAGFNSDPRGLNSDPDPAPGLPEREVPLGPLLGDGSDGQAPAARSADDGRRPSVGRDTCAREGGFAASSSDHSPSKDDEPRKAVKAKHTRQQLALVDEVRAYLPEQLKTDTSVPTVSDAILKVLDPSNPETRTVEELGERIRRRWFLHGYQGKEIRSPIGAVLDLVRPYKRGDRWGCPNPRCDFGVVLETQEDCATCIARIAERRYARRDGDGAQQAAQGPLVPAQRAEIMWWDCADCGNPGKGQAPADGLCRPCRQKALYEEVPPAEEFDWEATADAWAADSEAAWLTLLEEAYAEHAGREEQAAEVRRLEEARRRKQREEAEETARLRAEIAAQYPELAAAGQGPPPF